MTCAKPTEAGSQNIRGEGGQVFRWNRRVRMKRNGFRLHQFQWMIFAQKMGQQIKEATVLFCRLSQHTFLIRKLDNNRKMGTFQSAMSVFWRIFYSPIYNDQTTVSSESSKPPPNQRKDSPKDFEVSSNQPNLRSNQPCL